MRQTENERDLFDPQALASTTSEASARQPQESAVNGHDIASALAAAGVIGTAGAGLGTATPWSHHSLPTTMRSEEPNGSVVNSSRSWVVGNGTGFDNGECDNVMDDGMVGIMCFFDRFLLQS
jgi:hypothetical protein